MLRLAFLFATAAALAACNEHNADSCGNSDIALAHPDECMGQGSGTDSGNGGTCKVSADCHDTNLSVCDTAQSGGACVQCTAGDKHACSGTTPVCSAADSCQACVMDTDCPVTGGTAGVCMPTGACADETNIVYVATPGSNMSAQCGASTMPCDLITGLAIAQSAPKLNNNPTRNVLKLLAGTYTSTGNNFPIDVDTGANLTVDARSAIFHRQGNGPLFTINSGKGMTLLGGTIDTAPGGNSNGDGIACSSNGTLVVYDTIIQNNDKSGITTTNCDLTLNGVSIHDNSKMGPFPGINVSDGKVKVYKSRIANQKGGGLIVSNNATFDIVDSTFSGNGDPNTSTTGGVSLNTSTAGNRFDFNTVTNNKSKASLAAGGVIALVSSAFTASNNIVWNNNGSTDAQVSGAPFAYCDIGPAMVIGATDGGNNIASDPMFKDPNTDLQPQSGSPVTGKANPNAVLASPVDKDIKGTTRVAPADIGAYVVPAS